MLIFLCITATILLVIAVTTLIYGLSENDFMMSIIGIVLLIICICAIIDIIKDLTAINTEPTTLDVYQGKTTLQITYQDSIPIDSVVVFKE